jgi:hypothetical protein
MKHNFAGDECNNVNNCVVMDMWVVGTKITPESWASQSNMIVNLTVGKCSQQQTANIYSNTLMTS